MANIPLAPEAIQIIPVVSSRRATMHVYNVNWDSLMEDLIEEDIDMDRGIDFMTTINFCWGALSQPLGRRKHPVGTNELWPYFGLTIQQAADSVNVSKTTLRRRAGEDGYMTWPVPTGVVNVLVCAQFFVGGVYIRKRAFGVNRALHWNDARQQIVNQLGLEFIQILLARFFVEVNALQRGPIINQEQWQECVDMPNDRINILVSV